MERLVGPLSMRREQVTRPWRASSTQDHLHHLAALGEISAADDDPVFVLGATWRCGSTLLQRMLVSSGEVVVWGEPWNRCDVVGRLRRSLAAFDGRWPGTGATTWDTTDAEDLAGRWIANLFPPVDSLVESHRALLRTLLAEPAADRRWGAKFVRADIDDARYLHFLFPHARFVFLVRDPYESWRSYRAFGLRSFVRWPDDPVITARRFGRLWSTRVSGFVEHADEVDGLVVRYEELTAPETVARIESHVGVVVDPSVLGETVGGTDEVALDPLDAWRLRRALGATPAAVGY